MPLPVRSLPVLQNWDCHGCSGCCREYLVSVTDAEKARIESQGWENDPVMKGVKLFAKFGKWWNRRNRLNHREDGSCVFLNETGGCRIHAKFGSEGKPFACRVFPFMLVPTGDHWRVGLRFACPSVTADKGRPLDAHMEDVRSYARTLEEKQGIGKTIMAAPLLQRAQSAPWSDLFLFVRSLRGILGSPEHPIEWRLRKAMAFAQLCRQASFDKTTGNKLVEFLELVSGGIEEEVPLNPEDLAPPGWIGRILFRQAVALYSRKDNGPFRGTSRHGRLALIWAAWKFARGSGRIPRLHSAMPKTTFEAVEVPAGPMPAESEALLTRYYLAKLESLQFCGATNFNRWFWDGFETLAFIFPATMWLSRVFRDMPRHAAIARALEIVDDNFGFNPLLGSHRHTRAMRTLASRGEMARLIAWYSR